MGFRDVLTAGATLIRDAIQSANFGSNSGWQINQDGSAIFNNLTARGKFLATLRGQPNTDVLEYVNRLAYSDTFQFFDNSGYTTTPASIPGVAVILPVQLYQSMVTQLQPFAGKGRILRWTLTASFTVKSTSASGSGGHFHARLVYPDGTWDPYFAQVRNGTNDGFNMITQSWSNQDSVDGVIAQYNGSAPGPTINIRNTGSTPYFLDTVSWVMTYKIL